MKRIRQIIFVVTILQAAWVCADEPRRLNLPDQPFEYANVELPIHVRSVAKFFDNTPQDNPITNHGATLGRVLFYDKSLSVNGSVACASCHQQKLAFTDDRPLSRGFDDQPVSRNSMSLVNVRYYRNGRMFWDERADSLEAQVLQPIENKLEMGHQLTALVKQLANDPIYPPLFSNAFGDEKVTTKRISRSLAQFVRSIVSFQSKYDVGRAKVESHLDPFPNFTQSENLGKEQFFGRGKCASCHMEQPDDLAAKKTGYQSAFFFLFEPVVSGVVVDDPKSDPGVAEHSGKKTDVGKFKVPSLRNIALTAPYMHDGRFRLLDQVVEHYNWSVKPHPNLDERIQEFTEGLALPEVEKNALGEFLLTLTDNQLINDKRFSDPFVSPK
ncbi:MAG: cytochrome c peroxidase [Planctomycetota bacterium]